MHVARTRLAHPRALEPAARTASLATRRSLTLRAIPLHAFTLIELVIVVAIILVILGMILPAATAMWDSRRIADAQNTIQGLLMTSRARALRTNGADTGLLFFVDHQGTQRIATIEQEARGHPAWQNMFRVTSDRIRLLPKPMRVVPRYVVVEASSGVDPSTVFSADELDNNDFEDPTSAGASTIDEAQRHRNFFSMIYSSDGNLVAGRDVLISDVDADENGRGDVTGLPVGPDAEAANPVVEYYRRDGSKSKIDPTSDGERIGFPLIDTTSMPGIAINFPSIAGLLVYDDAVLTGLGPGAGDDKRTLLLETAQPFYVNRFTGAVIRGPVGESLVP